MYRQAWMLSGAMALMILSQGCISYVSTGEGKSDYDGKKRHEVAWGGSQQEIVIIDDQSDRIVTQEALIDRLDIARGITTSTSRNKALGSLAIESASLNHVDITLDALQGITNSSERNDAAARAALQLARCGNVKGANTVANTITMSTQKNEVLSDIVSGNY